MILSNIIDAWWYDKSNRVWQNYIPPSTYSKNIGVILWKKCNDFLLFYLQIYITGVVSNIAVICKDQIWRQKLQNICYIFW